jgi:hypothetical protein
MLGSLTLFARYEYRLRRVNQECPVKMGEMLELLGTNFKCICSGT